VILGCAVAVLWGAGDLLAAIAARKSGSFATLVIAQATELALCVALAIVLRPAVDAAPVSIAVLLLVGVLTAVAYGCLYRGLMLGPVALVTPIASAYAVGPIVLAVLVLDERLAPVNVAGAAFAIVGVVMATLRVGGGRGPSARGGVPFAFGAMAGFALSAFLIAALADRTGWVVAVLVSRIGVAVVLAITILSVPRAAKATSTAVRERWRSHGFRAAAAAGACNLGGTAVYAYGGQLGSVAIVSAVSALFPLVPVVGGVLMFGERLEALQIAGIATIVLGLVLLRPA
jgi:drug/metabolite transporter (DMT)-like permease